MAFRSKLWIDRNVQGVLLGRVIIYWVAAALYFGIATAVSIYCDHPTWTFSKLFTHWFATVGPWLPSAILLLPLVIYDILRVSHRFAGPIVRTRNHLSQIAQSPDCHPFSLRRDDYWHNLIPLMNAVQDQLRDLQETAKAPKGAAWVDGPVESGIAQPGSNSAS